MGLTLRIDQVLDFVLSVDLRFDSNGSFTVLLEDREKKEQYRIHYVCMSTYVWAEATDVYYGLGVQDVGTGGWRHLTRDVVVDLRKGLAHLRGRGRRLKINAKYRLVSISLHGKGALDNLTVSSSAHLANFFNGVNWLVRGQDAKGGWPIPVERRFNIPGMAALSPGWYSAMAQGQAISVLTRAYHVTGDEKYLHASLKATELFHTPAKDGGILARFLDRYAWYEEYPTMPSSFVLNGFIYSLIGLYDLKSALPEDDPRAYNVTELYKEGMISLCALLPLFDAGYTSIYDLRHFALGVAPNLARWDYHTTHISQLLLLATIDDSPVLRSTAERWIEYMKGKRASHN